LTLETRTLCTGRTK